MTFRCLGPPSVPCPSHLWEADGQNCAPQGQLPVKYRKYFKHVYVLTFLCYLCHSGAQRFEVRSGFRCVVNIETQCKTLLQRAYRQKTKGNRKKKRKVNIVGTEDIQKPVTYPSFLEKFLTYCRRESKFPLFPVFPLKTKCFCLKRALTLRWEFSQANSFTF